MAFLPFFVPGAEPLKVVILGGGYAGIAALITLHRHCPAGNVTIVDESPQHIKITHLHETFRRPLDEFLIPFHVIEKRFDCRHVTGKVEFSEHDLVEWQANKGLLLGSEFLDFDYLLVASGSGYASFDVPDNVFDLVDFTKTAGSVLLDGIPHDGEGVLSVVGGGATGIQFLFEIAYELRRRGLPWRLRLIDGEDRVLKQFTADLGRYVQARLEDLKIEFHPRTFYRGHSAETIRLEHRDSGDAFELESRAAFLFPGKKADSTVRTNVFGQAMVEGQMLPNVFAAGDVAQYRGPGSNTLTAQAAVRKGKLAARNILRHSGRLKILEPYLHRDLGYVVSLGPSDAVGWLALEGNVVAGYPAMVVKELVEAQYDLLLAGIDTYVI